MTAELASQLGSALHSFFCMASRSGLLGIVSSSIVKVCGTVFRGSGACTRSDGSSFHHLFTFSFFMT